MLYIIREETPCIGHRNMPDTFTFNLEDSVAVYSEVARRTGRSFGIYHTDGTPVWTSDNRYAACKVCPIRSCNCTLEKPLCRA